MINKILFTAAVIVVIYLLYRARTTRASVPGRSQASPPARRSRVGLFAAYGLAGLAVLVSAGWYYLDWREDHRVVTIRVIDAGSGKATVYRAYKKAITGNRFKSLDGKTVILGESERVEMIESQ
jgi:hypothetical protein